MEFLNENAVKNLSVFVEHYDRRFLFFLTSETLLLVLYNNIFLKTP